MGSGAMGNALQLTMTGMIVVFTGLVLLSLLMLIFQHVDRWLAERQVQHSSRVAATPKPEIAQQHQEDATLSPELVAVIAAAAHEAFGRQVRVTRIRYRSGPSESTWSRQGRITIMGSHHTKR